MADLRARGWSSSIEKWNVLLPVDVVLLGSEQEQEEEWKVGGDMMMMMGMKMILNSSSSCALTERWRTIIGLLYVSSFWSSSLWGPKNERDWIVGCNSYKNMDKWQPCCVGFHRQNSSNLHDYHLVPIPTREEEKVDDKTNSKRGAFG